MRFWLFFGIWRFFWNLVNMKLILFRPLFDYTLVRQSVPAQFLMFAVGSNIFTWVDFDQKTVSKFKFFLPGYSSVLLIYNFPIKIFQHDRWSILQAKLYLNVLDPNEISLKPKTKSYLFFALYIFFYREIYNAVASPVPGMRSYALNSVMLVSRSLLWLVPALFRFVTVSKS